MPRLALNDAEKIVCSKRGILEEYMMLRRMDNRKMAERLGISDVAFKYKREDSGKFTGMELAKINVILQIPKEKYI